MKQIKILELINQWGYLDTYQVAKLMKKGLSATDALIRTLVSKKFLEVNQDTRKNIYFLSTSGSQQIGQANTKRRFLLGELKHQALMIEWLCAQSNIMSYTTELEMKRNNSLSDKYPDLIIKLKDQSQVWVEIERTRKTKVRIERKIDYMRDWIKAGHRIIWVVPNEQMKNFICEQISEYNWASYAHVVEIFVDEESKRRKENV